MSLKDNIGNYTPSNFDRARLDFKVIREQDGVPISIYFELSQCKEITTKAGETAIVLEGKAELGIDGLSDARIQELENISQLKRDKPSDVFFYPIGSMFTNQMIAVFGEDWKTTAVDKLMHIQYNGKKDNPKKPGTKFHQVFVDEVTGE